MIETDKTFASFIIYCDRCSYEEVFDTGDPGFVDFVDGVRQAKESGWIIIKRADGTYNHYCSQECLEKDVY